MQIVTRDQLVEDVQRRTHKTFDDRTKPITLAGLHIELAESCDTLSGMIRSIDVGDDYLVRSELVTIKAGEASMDLSLILNGTLLGLKKVSWMDAGGRTVPLRHAGIDELHDSHGFTGVWSQSTPTYRLVANSLEFYPTPAVDMQVVVTYVASIVVSDAASWTANMGPGWRRWVVADACRKVMIANNQPDMARMFEAEANQAWNTIVSTNMERDEYVLRGIRNVEPDWPYDPWIPQRTWGYRR